MKRTAPRGTSYVTSALVTNFLGGASFDYTVAGPNGQLGTATVAVSLEHVEQPPCANELWKAAA